MHRGKWITWLTPVAAALLLCAASAVGQTQAPPQQAGIPPTREQQMQAIEKQIAELAKQLDELKKAQAQPEAKPAAAGLTLPPEFVKQLAWRCVGPANMGGRITALAVYDADPNVFWAATASGGLLKTVNGGMTFEHQFDKETTVSIGDVTISQSDPNIVWVGTGENNPRNSVSYGDGVYKSTDGGKTWKNMGLKQSFQIGKVLVHPKNPNIVYVGALGRLYGPNPERGLFKTSNGGETWEKILYFDDKTGVIDMLMHPNDPETLLVAMWERKRDGFDATVGITPADGYDGYDPIVKWGPHAGIYKTTDGGKNFKKLAKGLPTNAFGRVGLDVYRKNPNTVFAIIDCEKIGMGTPPPTGTGQAYLGMFGEETDKGMKATRFVDDSPAAKAGIKENDIVMSVDGKETKAVADLTLAIQDKKPGDKVKVKLERDGKPLEIEVTLGTRPQGGPGGGPGGATPSAPGSNFAKRPYTAWYGGQRENVQDRQGKDGHEFGGIYKSTDFGETWTRINSFNPRPMYFSLVRVDPTDENVVYVPGVNMHKSTDGGKTIRADAKTSREVHSDYHAMWINPKDSRHIIVGVDGGVYVTRDRMANWDHLNLNAVGQFYHVCVDTRKPYWVYGGLQDNGSWGGPTVNLKGGGMFGGRTDGPINEDWIYINGGDGFVCRVDPTDPDWVYAESQGGMMIRRNLRTGERAMIVPRRERGQPSYRFNWNTPFILSHHNPRIVYAAGEYVFKSVKRGDDMKIISPDITKSKQGSATALAESPLNPDVLWVGTDDGGLSVTRDGGKTWTSVVEKIGLPKLFWVATIEPSRFVEGRAYVCFDAHRSDNDDPWVYVTEDFGQTWKSLRGNLPTGSSRCLREDVKNPSLLYCGTEFALWASIDRGQSWTRMNNNLPTVAVHEVAVHPTEPEIVAATHGRSLWVLDVTTLRQATADNLKAEVTLFEPRSAIRWRSEPGRGGTNRKYVGDNPPSGAAIFYRLAKEAKSAELVIQDVDGKTIRTLTAPTSAGLHRVAWNLSRTPPRQQQPGGVTGMMGRVMGGGGRFGGFGPMADAGSYRVVLKVNDKEYSQIIRVEADPLLGAQQTTNQQEEDAELDRDGDGETDR